MNKSLRQLLLEKAIQHSSQYAGVQDKRLQDEELERKTREELRKEKIKQDIVLDQFERKQYMPLDMILKQSKQGQQVRRIIYSALNDINKKNYDGVSKKIENLSNLVKSDELDDQSLQSINNFLSGVKLRAFDLETLGEFPIDYDAFMEDITNLLNNISNKDTSPDELKQDLVDLATYDELLKIFNSSEGKTIDEKKEILEKLGADSDAIPTGRHISINNYGNKFIRGIMPPIEKPIPIAKKTEPLNQGVVIPDEITGKKPTAQVQLSLPIVEKPTKGTIYVEPLTISLDNLPLKTLEDLRDNLFSGKHSVSNRRNHRKAAKIAKLKEYNVSLPTFTRTPSHKTLNNIGLQAISDAIFKKKVGKGKKKRQFYS